MPNNTLQRTDAGGRPFSALRVLRRQPLSLSLNSLGDYVPHHSLDMGFDLYGEGTRYFRLSSSGWPHYLQVARDYGWQPAGTLSPADFAADAQWPAHVYDSNDAQRVTAEDARVMAAALERAVASGHLDGESVVFVRGLVSFLQGGAFVVR